MPGFRGATHGTTTQRGYGTPHAKARAQAFAALPEYSPCCRCGHTMWKWHTEPTGMTGRTRSALHYDHNGERTGYLGFSCADCNRKAGAKQGARVANSRHGRPQRTSRAWQSRTW